MAPTPRRVRDNDESFVFTALFARIALGAAFLSAVADRFGWWGPLGARNVAWGDFGAFTQYVHQLAPYLPSGLTSLAAWCATLTETALGVALIAGAWLRYTALASAATLLVFAVSMACFTGVQAPLNASVFTAAGAALLLASTATASARAAPRRDQTTRVGRRAQS